MTRRRSAAAAVGAGLALADASVVVLALPPILTEFDASVQAAVAVIGAYTLALAVAVPITMSFHRRHRDAPLAALGMLGFALAGAGCGVAGAIAPLVALRAAQGAAAAVVLVGAFELLGAGGAGSAGRRAWVAAAVFGAAIGPALGGALTVLLDWRAIFLVQAPVVAAAAVACWEPARAGAPAAGRAPVTATAVCLALLSAALTGVLFLAVLLLIFGWGLSPLAAAAVVSVLPLAALLGTRLPGDHAARAIVGSALVGIGVLCLAFLPLDTVAMTIVPQVVAGLGMGMALPAVAGGLLPERTAADAAHLLAVRHVGITVAIALLAPVAAAQIEHAAAGTRERGAALILDARLPPQDKLRLAQVATAKLDAAAPRTALRDSLVEAEGELGADRRAEYEHLRQRTDETLVIAINDAFAPAFLICGAFGLLAAGGLLLVVRPRLRRAALATCAIAAILVPAQAAFAAALRPDEVTIADPCAPRALPRTGGTDGLLQDGALVLLDAAACRFGSSREKLALALIDPERARAYANRHKIRRGALDGLLSEILGTGRSLWGLLGRLLGP
jgi:hypothetical protein